MKTKGEILAPCGGMAQLIAAVRTGADAVYLGLKGHNARSKAENFDQDQLVQAVSFCHARNVKVYVTLNTLVFDNEIQDIVNALRSIALSGADAVIVQDLAVAKLAQQHCSSLALHGSTQMAVHNVSGAKALLEMGFKRVVLARELSFEEVKEITKNVDIETEVFVHGALCVSMSGNCYLSSMIGQMSGNRGNCKGPCRLNFKNGERDYALSLKDMSHISAVPQLVDAGVSSFKIEGRLKGAEYVALAVDAVSKSRDSLPYDTEDLRAVFSRSGFSSGYLTGNRSPDMFGTRTEHDERLTEKLGKKPKELFRRERQNVDVSVSLDINSNQSIISITDGENQLSSIFSGGEQPLTQPTGYNSALESVSKTGGTPFRVTELNFKNEQQLFLSKALINAERKKLLEQLLEIREQPKPKEFLNILNSAETSTIKFTQQSTATPYHVRFEKFSQTTLFSNQELSNFSLPLSEIVSNLDDINKKGVKPVIELLNFIFPFEEPIVSKQLETLKQQGFKTVKVQNIGGLYMAKKLGFEVLGGFSLNITNSLALEQYKLLGLKNAEVSFELSANKIKQLDKTIDVGIVAYGFLPLMYFRSCPAKTKKGCAVCDKTPKLVDRLNNSFTLLCIDQQYSILLNYACLDVTNKTIDNQDFRTLYFTTETAETCYNVFQNKNKTQENLTNGLFFREVF